VQGEGWVVVRLGLFGDGGDGKRDQWDGGVETLENREDGREKYGIVVGLEIGGYTV
jgi:hypothetical protein